MYFIMRILHKIFRHLYSCCAVLIKKNIANFACQICSVISVEEEYLVIITFSNYNNNPETPLTLTIILILGIQ